ncbi:MAG: TolC family protein [Rikenellaceae bacterium]
MTCKKIFYVVLAIVAPVAAMAQQHLTLSDAIKVGLENNYGIQIIQKSTEVASLRNSWAMAGAVPTISLSGAAEVDYETVASASTVSAYVSAGLSWTLFDGFQIKATKAILDNNEELAQGEEMLYIENTIQSIIDSYYYVLLQQEMLNINKTLMDISYDRYIQQENAKDIGSGGTYEYTLAKSDYLTDRSSYLNQELVLRDAVRSLNLLLSAEVETQWVLSEEIVTPSKDYQFDNMKELMFSDNRTLNNQYINVKTKELEIKQQKSSRYPTIALYASATPGVSRASGVNTSYFSNKVGLSLSYTLFNGGQISRNIDIAEVSSEAEKLNTEQIKLTLEVELANQYDTYNVYKELVKIDTEQFELSEILLKMSEERYKEGVITSFDFREVQISYLQSAISRLNSTFNLIVSNSQLLRLTGGILSY